MGLTGGSLVSGDNEIGTFADGGFGGWLRGRPVGGLGAQLDVGYYFGRTSRPLTIQARQQVQVAASAMWFVLPQSVVTPYVLGGATYNYRVAQDQTFGTGFPDRASLFGPHGGAGLEIALGRSAVLDFEARYVGHLLRASDDPVGTVTATVGIGTHF